MLLTLDTPTYERETLNPSYLKTQKSRINAHMYKHAVIITVYPVSIWSCLYTKIHQDLLIKTLGIM